jgi:hypothetical protein
MSIHDVHLVQPAPAEMERALFAAVDAANGRSRAGVLTWPLSGLFDMLVRVAIEPEGRHVWEGAARAGPGPRSAVAVAWRRDFAGRLHARLVGLRDALRGQAPVDLFGVPEHWPALIRVHPAATLLRERVGRTEPVALCPCGDAGYVDEIGWMGDCCGPCFDRRAAVGASPSPAAWPLPLPRAYLGLPVASADGAFMAALAGDGKLHVQDTRAGREARAVLPEGAGRPAALSAGGRRVLLVRPAGQTATVWDVAEGSPVATLPLAVLHLATFLPDGVVVFTVQGVPRLWAADGGAPQVFEGGEVGGFTDGLSVGPGGRVLATTNSRHGLRLWDVAERRLAARLDFPGHNPFDVAFSPDGALLAVSFRPLSRDALVLYDLDRGAVCHSLRGPAARRSRPAFTPDGRLLLALEGACVGAWDVATGRELAHCRATPGGRWLALLGDGRLASMTADGIVRLWPAEALCGG